MPPGVGEPEPEVGGANAVYIWEYCEEVGLAAAPDGGAADGLRWEWQGDDGAWTAYDSDTCDILEAAFADMSGPRVTGAPVEIGNERWVNLKKMRQCRWDNPERLTVRRVNPAGDVGAAIEHEWVAYGHDQCVVLTEAYLQEVDPPVVVLDGGANVDFRDMSHTIPGDDRRFRIRGRMNEHAPPVPRR